MIIPSLYLRLCHSCLWGRGWSKFCLRRPTVPCWTPSSGCHIRCWASSTALWPLRWDGALPAATRCQICA